MFKLSHKAILLVLIYSPGYSNQKVRAVTLQPSPKIKITVNARAEPTESSSLKKMISFRSTFKKSENVPLKFPQTVLLKAPLATNKVIRAMKESEDSSQVQYRFKFYPRTIEGLLVSLDLPLETTKAFTVPLASVFSPNGKQTFVYQLNDEKSVRKEVHVLHYAGETLIVKGSKLDADQPLIVSSINHLMNGSSVEVLP